MIAIIVISIIATSLMTAFSYLTATLFREPWKEPLLLGFLIANRNAAIEESHRVAGWVLHYVIGIAFVVLFKIGIWRDWYDMSWTVAVVYGVVIGCIGILSWKLMFRLSRQNPPMHFTGYYTQLFLAHLVFAFTVVGCYRMIGDFF